jgi:hypothetical protein
MQEMKLNDGSSKWKPSLLEIQRSMNIFWQLDWGFRSVGSGSGTDLSMSHSIVRVPFNRNLFRSTVHCLRLQYLISSFQLRTQILKNKKIFLLEDEFK